MSDSHPHQVPQLYRYRFGAAEFDESRFELTVAGKVVEVQRKPLEVLAFLLRNAAEVVTREELLEQIWDDRPTVEHVVNNALAKLRAALGAEEGARIVTKPRVGYLFTGPVEKTAVGRRLISAFDFVAGVPVPRRESYLLQTLLERSQGNEVWLGINPKTGERRVYKFCIDGAHLAALKRESSLYRVLRQNLGDRTDFVRVLDWNFEAAPFFIEYEPGGLNLAQWAETNGRLTALPLARRLELFLQVVDAVAAAHSVGVLHKDLKPSNILVTESAESIQLRVADFGSGRLIDDARAVGITHHEMGQTSGISSDPMAGTAMYLAPEIMAGQPSTVQGDVYALGIILYQFVTGLFSKPLVPGWERDIDDPILARDIADATDGDPLRRIPSAAILAERLRSLEQRRRTSLEVAESELSARRVQEDLRQRQARRPYFIAVIALLLVGFGSSVALYLRELHTRQQLVVSRAQVQQQASRAESVTRFLQDEVLSATDPFREQAKKDQTIQSALVDAVGRLDRQPPNDPLTEALLRMTLGRVLVRIVEPALAEEQWRRVLVLLRQAAAPANIAAESHYSLAQTLTLQSRFQEAERELQTADSLAAKLTAADVRTATLQDMSWGTYYMDQQQCSKAIPHLERALRLARTNDTLGHSDIDIASVTLGQCYNGVSRFADAEKLSADLLESLAKRPNPSELTRALGQSVYAEALLYQGRYEQAAPILDQAFHVTLDRLGLSNLRTISILNTRCNLFFMTSQLEKALVCQEQSYEATRLRYGDTNWATWGSLANVGTIQFMLRQYPVAAKTLDTARVGLEKSLGPDKPSTLLCDYYLAYSLLKLHQAERAEGYTSKLTPRRLEEAEPGAPWELRIALLRGLLLIDRGRHAQGVTVIEQALQAKPTAQDPLDTILVDAKEVLAKKYEILSH